VRAAAVLATIALAGGGVYLAFGDDEDRPSLGTDPASTAIPGTFAVDLSTGAEGPATATVLVPSPTLPLPSISLPLPGASPTAGPTTVG
jgi:hypothetical protein